MGESTVYVIGAIVAGGAAVVSLFIGKLRHGEAKYMASVGVLLALVLATIAYISFRSEAALYTRFDGHDIHAGRFLFEAIALTLLVAGLTRCASHTIYEVVYISGITLLWGLLLLLSSNGRTEGGIILFFIFAAILAVYSIYLIWNGSFVRSAYYVVARWMYVIFVILLFLGFVLAQPGFAVLGVFGTSVWFAVTDFLFYIILGAAVLFCPECCSTTTTTKSVSCCAGCGGNHAYGTPCVVTSSTTPATFYPQHNHHSYSHPTHHHHHQHASTRMDLSV